MTLHLEALERTEEKHLSPFPLRSPGLYLDLRPGGSVTRRRQPTRRVTYPAHDTLPTLR